MIDTADPASPATKRGTRRLARERIRTSAVLPLLLADKADYVFGYVADESKRHRVMASHEAFVQLVEKCAEKTREPAVEAVTRFLRNSPLAQVELPEDFHPGSTITFRVEGVFPIDLPAVQES